MVLVGDGRCRRRGLLKGVVRVVEEARLAGRRRRLLVVEGGVSSNKCGFFAEEFRADSGKSALRRWAIGIDGVCGLGWERVLDRVLFWVSNVEFSGRCREI